MASAIPLLVAWCEQTGTPAYRSRQRDAIEDLATCRLPVADAIAALDAVEPATEWRYRLTRLEVSGALRRHLSKQLSAEDLQQWAAVLHRRPDVGAELEHYVVIGKVLSAIANPGSDLYLSLDRPRDLLEALGVAQPRWYTRPGVLAWLGALGYTVAMQVTGADRERPLWTATVLACHAVCFQLDWIRFGRVAALAAARREALITLPLVLVVAALGVMQ